MELSDIRDEVRERMGIPAADQGITDTVLTLLVNAAVRQVNARYEWPWLEARASYTTVAGTEAIAEPADGIRRMRWMRQDNNELVFRNYRDTGDYFAYEGAPVWYSEEGGVYNLMPTPDGPYDIEYGYLIDAEPILAADDDEPLIPYHSIDLLIVRTAVLVSRRLRMREDEKVFYAEYERALRALRDNMAETMEGYLPRRVGRNGSTNTRR